MLSGLGSGSIKGLTSGKEKVGTAIAAIPFCVTMPTLHQDLRCKIGYCDKHAKFKPINLNDK